MSFGLCNALATFKRLMVVVLRGLLRKNYLVHPNGIILVGRSFEENLSNLREVFSRLRTALFQLNIKNSLSEKYLFPWPYVPAEGIATDPDKIKPFQDGSKPKEKH